MKRIALTLTGIALVSLPLSQVAQAGVDVNVNVGVPVVPVPVPVIPVPPPIAVPAPPEFIFPPGLGFYVAVDVPYDIFFIGSTYYLYRDGYWYRSRYYNGPWRHTEHRHLPPGLRKHKIDRIRHHRDDEFRHYRHDHDHYRGRHFRPDKEWKEERKERRRAEKEYRKEERRREKEERRGEGHDHGRHGGRD